MHEARLRCCCCVDDGVALRLKEGAELKCFALFAGFVDEKDTAAGGATADRGGGLIAVDQHDFRDTTVDDRRCRSVYNCVQAEEGERNSRSVMPLPRKLGYSYSKVFCPSSPAWGGEVDGSALINSARRSS